jgi:hypothetical protein
MQAWKEYFTSPNFIIEVLVLVVILQWLFPLIKKWLVPRVGGWIGKKIKAADERDRLRFELKLIQCRKHPEMVAEAYLEAVYFLVYGFFLLLLAVVTYFFEKADPLTPALGIRIVIFLGGARLLMSALNDMSTARKLRAYLLQDDVKDDPE